MTTNTAPNASTFDLDPPRRPGADDFNGLTKQNVGGLPVKDPATMLSSEEWNTSGHLHIAAGKVHATAMLVLGSDAGRSILGVIAPGNTVDADSFTVTVVGTGNVKVDWATSGEGALPTLFAARATAYEDARATSICTFPFAAGTGRQGVQIKTEVAGAPADLKILVEIF